MIKIIGEKVYFDMIHVATLNEMSMSKELDKFKYFLTNASNKIKQLHDQIESLESELSELGEKYES